MPLPNCLLGALLGVIMEQRECPSLTREQEAMAKMVKEAGSRKVITWEHYFCQLNGNRKRAYCGKTAWEKMKNKKRKVTREQKEIKRSKDGKIQWSKEGSWE